jgi:hypothetical protein
VRASALIVLALGRGNALFLGAFLAGSLLPLGFAPGTVPIAATPGLLIAIAAAIVLVSRQKTVANRESQ